MLPCITPPHSSHLGAPTLLVDPLEDLLGTLGVLIESRALWKSSIVSFLAQTKSWRKSRKTSLKNQTADGSFVGMMVLPWIDINRFVW